MIVLHLKSTDADCYFSSLAFVDEGYNQEHLRTTCQALGIRNPAIVGLFDFNRELVPIEAGAFNTWGLNHLSITSGSDFDFDLRED